MTCANEASPSINSASPGALGSTDTAEIVGDAVKSTTTTFAWRAIWRAIVSAVKVMLAFEAVPSTVILRAAAPASRKSSARRSISEKADIISAAAGRATTSGSNSGWGSGSAVAMDAAAAGTRTAAGADVKAATARGAVTRNNSPVTITPVLSIRVANVAISTIGSFFG